jgi:hypothetical protein
MASRDLNFSLGLMFISRQSREITINGSPACLNLFGKGTAPADGFPAELET